MFSARSCSLSLSSSSLVWKAPAAGRGVRLRDWWINLLLLLLLLVVVLGTLGDRISSVALRLSCCIGLLRLPVGFTVAEEEFVALPSPLDITRPALTSRLDMKPRVPEGLETCAVAALGTILAEKFNRSVERSDGGGCGGDVDGKMPKAK